MRVLKEKGSQKKGIINVYIPFLVSYLRKKVCWLVQGDWFVNWLDVELEVCLLISSGMLMWKYSLSWSRSTSNLGTYKDPSSAAKGLNTPL